MSVKTALGVGNIEFVSCSSKVYNVMSGYRIINSAVGLPALLHDGLKILIYAGESDLICNWLGIIYASNFSSFTFFHPLSLA